MIQRFSRKDYDSEAGPAVKSSKGGRIVGYFILAWLTVAALILALDAATPGILDGLDDGAVAIGAAVGCVGVWLAAVLWVELRSR